MYVCMYVNMSCICVLTCNLHVVHTCSTYMMYAYMHTRVCHVPHVCVPHVCHIYIKLHILYVHEGTIVYLL